MGRNIKIIFNLLFLAVMTPFLFYVTDYFIDPATGILVTMGASDAELAAVGAVPWIVPIGYFIWIIINFGKKEEPRYPGGFGR